MARHLYKAVDETGKVRRGTAVALHGQDLEKRLTQQGLILISSRQLEQNRRSRFRLPGKLNMRLLIEFYRRFSQTLEMGLPIFTVLDENFKVIPSESFRRAIEEIRSSLEDGGSLGSAMDRFPKIFSKLDVGLVRMGEQTGVLPQCLDDLANFLEWKEDNRGLIRRATIYPSFLMLAISAVVGVWVGYVLPRVANLLLELGVTLPAITRALLGASHFLQSHWPWLIFSLLAVLASLYGLQSTQRGKKLLHKWMLRLPLIGEVLASVSYSRLCHNFSIMQRSGMTLPRIFTALSDSLLGNRYLEERVSLAFQELQLGQSLSDSFESAGGFPSLLSEAVRHGELTGKLEDSFKRMGDYYDGEAKRKVQTMVQSFEPIILLIMGGVFGLVILSILLPLYDVLGNYGRAY